MKNILKVWILLVVLLLCGNVYAEEYYKNKYGVNMTQEEYDYITDMFYDGYQEFVTLNEYNKMIKNDIFNNPIEKYSDSMSISPKSSTTQKGRTLTVTKSCSTNCLISITTTWNLTPTIKSYDVIGARINNTSIVNYNSAVVTGSGYSKVYSTPNKKNNGFGYSIKMPSVSNVKVTTSFYVKKSGSITGTYQHATSNISLANSKLYNISASGLGGVFSFYGAASNKYDGMNGLTLYMN